MHHPRCPHPCVAFAKLLCLKGKILQASLLVISSNVFLFSSPPATQPRCCVFLAEMVSPAWRPLTLLLWLPTTSFSSWMRTCPPPRSPSQHLAKLPSQFCGLCICAAHGNGNWASSTKWCLDGYSLSWMRLPQLGHRHQLWMFRNAIARPSYAVCQMEHRFTLFQYVTPYQSQLNLNVHPIGNIISPPRLSIRMLFVVKLQISQVGHIRLLTVASNHPRRVFLLKLGFLPRFCFTIWEEF